MKARWALICGAVVAAGLAIPSLTASAAGPAASANVRVTVDNGTKGAYMSADQLAGGSYSDGV